MAYRNSVVLDAQRGISGSRYNLSYVQECENVDIFTEQGTARLFPRVEVDDVTSTVASGKCDIDEAVITVSAPDETTYFFSMVSGRIWVRTDGGFCTELRPNPNATGGHTGADFHFGKLYYFTDTTIGRFDWGTTANRNDNYAVGLQAGPGICNYTWVIRGIMYFTNGAYVGAIDKRGNINNQALALPTGQVSATMTSIGYRLRVATAASDVGANMYVGTANSRAKFLSNGERGDLFQDTGNQVWFRRRIPNQKTFKSPWAQTIWRSLPIFGWEDKIYTIFKQEEGDHHVMCVAFTLPFEEGTIINSLSNSQANNMVVSWDGWSSSYDEPDMLDAGGDSFFVSYTRPNGKSGILKMNPDKFAEEGHITFPVVSAEMSTTKDEFKDFKVFTDHIPEGTNVELWADVNTKGFDIIQNYPYCTDTEFHKLCAESQDKLRKMVEHRGSFKHLGDNHLVQAKVVLKSNEDGVDSPVIRSFIKLQS